MAKNVVTTDWPCLGSKPPQGRASFLSSVTNLTANFPPVLLALGIAKVEMDLPSAQKQFFCALPVLENAAVSFKSMPCTRH